MGWVAPIAAAAQQKKEEKYFLEKLREADPEGIYEFKVLQGGFSTFTNADDLQRILDIERQGSWDFVEKIDNKRVILRRPKKSKTQDAYRDESYEPYGIYYGASKKTTVSLIIGLLLIVGFLFMFGIFQARSSNLLDVSSMPMVITALSIFVLIVLMSIKKRLK